MEFIDGSKDKYLNNTFNKFVNATKLHTKICSPNDNYNYYYTVDLILNPEYFNYINNVSTSIDNTILLLKKINEANKEGKAQAYFFPDPKGLVIFFTDDRYKLINKLDEKIRDMYYYIVNTIISSGKTIAAIDPGDEVFQ